MKMPRDPEALMASWLDEGPAHLPMDTRQAIVVGIRTMPRRSRGMSWPTIDWRRQYGALVGAAALVLVAVVALGIYFNGSGVGVQPSPTPSASPTAGSSRFTSTIHGITLDYPSDWQVRAASEPFAFGPAPVFDAPNVDVIFDQALQDELYFALVSWKLNVTPTNDGCCSALLQATPSCTEAGDPWWVDYTLDGSDHGFIRECHDEDGARRHTVAVAKNGRAYIIQLRVGDAAQQEPYDAAWFVSVLDTVHLFPVEATNP